MSTDKKTNERISTETAILEKYGLRWAVLAAWCDDLEGRGLKVPREVWNSLAEARVKISSGCFSSCDVGCDLGTVEGQLVSLAASSGADGAADSVTLWLELLAHAMVATTSTERLLNIPAVKFRYAECGFGPCGCDG
jgi:hypothetical protein